MKTIETQFGNTPLKLETGRLARQADGSVLVTHGETVVLVTAVAAKGASEQDFFPLSVHYVEKGYASGKIPGGFFKREGKLSDRETLLSRIIDRSIRPLFDEHFSSETVVMATVLSYDKEHSPEIAAMAGASAALYISDIPYNNPVAGARVGYLDGEFVLNPNPAQLADSEIDIFMTASKDSIVMVEGEAKEVSEKMMLDALDFGHKAIQSVLEAQEALRKDAGKTKREVVAPEVNQSLKAKVQEAFGTKVQEALAIKDKMERYAQFDVLKEELVAMFENDETVDLSEAKEILGDLKKDSMRSQILKEGKRIDGRTHKDIRPITCDPGFLPRAHGSALFTRGETQSLGVVTLGTREDEQMIDSMINDLTFKKFLLHYNFPAFSVGEARSPRPPGRREIGHGFLAERGLAAVLPSATEFPYTIRLVSEILESNGSSSMATVCSGALAMMNAGIPIKRSVAGIAMGLIYDDSSNYEILSDILGDEDHLGDMDFKVVGTSEGITALQMDIKIKGLERQTIEKALDQAREGLNHILGVMGESQSQSNELLSEYAPRMVTHKISKDKISTLIGPGGKMIKSITETTGVKVEVSNEGVVSMTSKDHRAVDQALKMVQDVTAEAEVGQIYEGPIKRVADFGAFVEILPGQEGLVHISKIAQEHIKNINQYVTEGEIVKVKVMGFDKRGKIQLSMKDAE